VSTYPRPSQLPLFDGERLKAEGIARVEEHNGSFVQVMRQVARNIATSKGWVTASDLREVASDYGLAPKHPNAWGAVFSSKEWEKVGEEPSRTATCHGHVNPRWRLKA
jgi:hypothetical protein